MAEKKVKKMEVDVGCAAGHHTYMVTNWNTTAGKKVAVHLMCRNCLMPIDIVEMRNAQWAKK